MTPDLVTAFKDLGFAGSLIVGVYAFYKGWVYSAAVVQELKDRIVKLEGKIDENVALTTEANKANAETIKVLEATILRLENTR